MIKQYKIDGVNQLKDKLAAKKNVIFTNYSGVNVKDLSVLRRKLSSKNADYKVVKNNLFKRALSESGYEGYEEYLKGPIGVAFVDEEIGETAKVLKEFKNENKKFSYSIGILDNTIYNEVEIEKIATLPSKDVVLAQTMSMINGPATGIAIGINQIMSSVARGIQAIAEANNK